MGGDLTSTSIGKRGVPARFVATNVSEGAQVDRPVAAAQECGGNDVMVRNAGITLPHDGEEDFHRLMCVNDHGVLCGARAAAHQRALADAPGPDGIRGNTLAPGTTDTAPPHETPDIGAAAESFCRRTPLRRLDTPSVAGDALTWPASGLSSHVTGTELVVHGDLAPTSGGPHLIALTRTTVQEPVMSNDDISETAKAVVRRNTEEVQGGGDYALYNALFSDDFVDHTPQPGRTPDKAGALELYQTLRAAFPDFHAVIHWQAADGDLVTTYKTYHGTHQGEFFGIAPTGREIRFETVDAMRVVDGKITEHWGVANLFSLMEQLGERPGTP